MSWFYPVTRSSLSAMTWGKVEGSQPVSLQYERGSQFLSGGKQRLAEVMKSPSISVFFLIKLIFKCKGKMKMNSSSFVFSAEGPSQGRPQKCEVNFIYYLLQFGIKERWSEPLVICFSRNIRLVETQRRSVFFLKLPCSKPAILKES